MVKPPGPGPGRRPRFSAQSLAGLKLYRDRLAAIRPLLDKATAARIPKASPTSYAKRKVRLYYQYLFGSEHGPGITQGIRDRVTVKSPRRREKLQAELGQGALPGIKYVWVPTVIDPRISAPMPVEITHRDRQPDIVEFGGTGTVRMNFDLAEMVEHPRAEVKRTMQALLDSLDFSPAAVSWHYLAGDRGFTYMKHTPSTEQGLMDALRGIMNAYPSYKGNHHWKRWLTGLELTYARGRHAPGKVKTIDTMRDEAYQRRKRIGKIKMSWLNALDAVEAKGLPVEAISRKIAGMVGDPGVALALADMKKAKLVSGDDNRWSITSAGKDYLLNGRSVRGI